MKTWTNTETRKHARVKTFATVAASTGRKTGASTVASTSTLSGETMQTRREYLISKGLAKPTRGKLSREALAEIDRAIREDGMQFSDLQDRPVVVKRAKPDRPKDANESVTDENKYAAAFMRYPLDQEFTYTHEGKTYTVSARLACMPCGYSLVGHMCNDPVVLTYHGAQSVRPKGE
jgi:hypothetical protein